MASPPLLSAHTPFLVATAALALALASASFCFGFGFRLGADPSPVAAGGVDIRRVADPSATVANRGAGAAGDASALPPAAPRDVASSAAAAAFSRIAFAFTFPLFNLVGLSDAGVEGPPLDDPAAPPAAAALALPALLLGFFIGLD
uniref:Uncharacterized protein n=1 Tax=Oryza brachyantha TaxID=4533 RepID=J3MCM6_ORYBR